MAVAALEAAGKEDAVGALNEVGKAVAGALDDRVVRVTRVAEPVVAGGIPAYLAAPDDADVVGLEAWAAKTRPTWLMPFGRGGPEVRGGMPGARRPASALAFQRICQAPAFTSGTSVPSSVVSIGSRNGRESCRSLRWQLVARYQYSFSVGANADSRSPQVRSSSGVRR